MKVRELIHELNKISDMELEVRTEGCDCWGDVGSVDVKEFVDGSFCLLSRSVGNDGNL